MYTFINNIHIYTGTGINVNFYYHKTNKIDLI
jgi:hypothetical protein